MRKLVYIIDGAEKVTTLKDAETARKNGHTVEVVLENIPAPKPKPCKYLYLNARTKKEKGV